MHHPLFSIIIPTFNSESTINLCIESIINQKFKDFEIIIVDGVSTDSTLTILSKCYENEKILIKSEKDNGIYDAMNKGIDLAKGEWLYFLGSDDTLIDKNVLEKVANLINKEKLDLVYGIVKGKDSRIEYKYDSKFTIYTKGIHHQSVFYNKGIFNKIGKYDMRFSVAADYHLTLKVFSNPKLIKKYIDIDIAYYGENGFSSKFYDYKYYSYHYKFLNKQGVKLDPIDSGNLISISIYCCLHQAMQKKDILFSWSNLIFYIFFCSELSIFMKIKSFYNMITWTIKLKK